MTYSCSAVFLVAFALLRPPGGIAEGQTADVSSGSKPEVLALNFTNNGQHVTATVGQQIEITLGTVGGPQYDGPLVSSTAIRLESTALHWPPTPGGPTFVYIFKAADAGEAQVTIPIVYSEAPDFVEKNTFVVTIQVRPGAGRPRPSGTLDQVNNAMWTKGWTGLQNDVRQTFTPSLPRLTSVEVELVVANPGPPDEEVTLTLLNAEGEVLAVVSKTVPVENCGHVLFVFPSSVWQVSPGQTYSIRLSGGSLFGWKYVEGGYKNGDASFNGKPLLPDKRSTFFFRTFGSN